MPFFDPGQIPLVSTFLLVFALVFGLLAYSKVGNFSSRVNAILALAFALFATLYEPLVAGLQQFMPLAAVLLIALFFLVFLKKIMAPKEKEDVLPIAATLGILLLVLGVLGNRLVAFLPAGFDATSALWVVGILIAILFFIAIYQQKQAA